MNELTFFDLFSGGGGAAQGAKQAGLKHIGGIELDPRIAEINRANHGVCHVANILETHPRNYDKPDWFHASPVCKSFSTAKVKWVRKEHPLDLACAAKVSEYIEFWQPDYFSLENVHGYINSDSFKGIVNTLLKCGYIPYWSVLNSADYGVPQNRRRLILLAKKLEFGLIKPQPKTEKLNSWYDSIKDLIPEFEQWDIKERVIKTLPRILKSSMYIDTSEGRHPARCTANKPALTIVAQGCASLRYRIIHNPLNLHIPIEQALLSCDIYRPNIKAYARLQSFPDNYIWSENRMINGTAIGNSVCPLFFEKLIRNELN